MPLFYISLAIGDLVVILLFLLAKNYSCITGDKTSWGAGLSLVT